MARRMTAGQAKGRAAKAGVLLAVVAGLIAASLGHALLVPESPMIGLWLTPDQQGRHLFEKGDYPAAAGRFQDPLWRGIAYYRSHNFDAAIEQFARVDTPDGYFDLGNAYAHSGQLEQAVSSYEEVLRRRPDDRAARENRDLLRAMIEQKKAREKEKEEQPLQGQPPTFKPDDIKIDDKGKQGRKGEVARVDLTADQVEALWMRRLQTTPSDFLRLKFASQVESPEASRPPGTSR